MRNTNIRHIFIINPAAGKGIESGPLIAKIRDACEVSEANYDIYITKSAGDATEYVNKTLQSRTDNEIFRFYACGGDGTLCEVAAGILSEQLAKGDQHAPKNVEIGCVPIGTGNDFVRNFGQNEFFSDITKQLLGEAMCIDGFGVRLDERREICGVNMFNVGFDCDVVCKAAELKKTVLPKKLAYVVGVAAILVKNKGCFINVTRHDGEKISRDFELCAVANGGYCGGGFFSAPRRDLRDGMLDISLIKKVSRTKFLALVGPYQKGRHLETKLGKEVVGYFQDRGIRFDFSEPTNVSIDGEISRVKSAEFRCLPSALNFVLPVGVTYNN